MTVYFADWCPFCRKLIEDLNAEQVEYTLVDVDNAPNAKEASEFVESVNDGNRIVPTVVFSDESTMTNPPVADVIAKLEELA